MSAGFNIAPPGYTPDTHPLRTVKPDPWMLNRARATVDALARALADDPRLACLTTPAPANAKDARP